MKTSTAISLHAPQQAGRSTKATALRFAVCALSLCWFAAQGAAAPPPASLSTGSKSLPIPPRFQWGANFGYCGEVSMISAGLFYGQYVSQYDARACANNSASQSNESNQLLLGVNEGLAASRLHLQITRWSGAGSGRFLSWVKQQVTLERPVIIGVYMNSSYFGGTGDSEYDHIVPVTGVGTKRPPGDLVYDANDTLTFSDNGLVGGDTPSSSPYFFTSAFGAFQRTRFQADAAGAPPYSLAKSGTNYGFAVTGVMDAYAETVPVTLSTSVNYESPAIREGSSTRPAASPLVLTIRVSGLKPGVSYRLYRYSTLASVPNGSFNASAVRAARTWSIQIASGSTFTTTETISSKDVAVYRAVPASAR